MCRGPLPSRIVADPSRVTMRTCAHAPAGAQCHSAMSCPSVTIQKLYRDPDPCRTPCRARCCECHSAPTPCNRVLSAVSQPLARCVATPGLPFLPRYKGLYHDTLRSPGHPRARARLYRAHCPSYYGACSVVSWASLGCIMAHPLRAHACCVTIQSAVS